MKRTSAFIIAVLLFVSSAVAVLNVSADSEELCIKAYVDSINGGRTVTAVAVYTPDFGESTKTSGKGTEIIVDASGTVIAVESGANNEIPNDGFVISAGAACALPFSKVTVGDKAFFDSEREILTVVSSEYNPFSSATFTFDGVNTLRRENTMIIYRNKEFSETNTWGYEVCVNADGYVVSVGGNNNPIPEGGFVISAIGTKKQPLIDASELGMFVELDLIGKTVKISYEAENASQSYRMRYEQMRAEIDYKIARYLDIDEEKAKRCLGALSSLCGEIENALTNNDIPEFMALTHAFEADSEEFSAAVIPHNPVEARTIWLRIPANKSKNVVENTVKDIYELGFNSVCIEALFDSTFIMPMPEDSYFEQNPAFGGEDMLKAYIDEFHKYGIEVHLWMSCYRVGYTGSQNTSRSVGVKKSEWLNLDQNGKETVYNEYGNAYFLNPALPEVKDFLLGTYKYILENYAIDGFQLDYVRYPENSSVNYGYDEYTKKLFKEKYGFENAPVSSSQLGWKEWCEFRASFVTDLVKSTGELINEIRPDVVFSCDVAPDYATSKTKMCQDTETWLKEGLVDIIYPMAYGTTDAVKKWTGITVDLAGNDIYTVMGLRDNGKEIYREQITESVYNGADGTAFFSYSQYVAGDYRGFIDKTVFAKSAVNPTMNSKNAVLAQLEHIKQTVETRVLAEDASDNIKAFSDSLENLSSAVEDVRKKLESSDIEAAEDQINAVVGQCSELIDSLNKAESEDCGFAADYLKRAFGIIEKAVINSKDKEKAEYLKSHSEESEAESEISRDDTSDDSDTEKKTSWFEKIFQVIFMAVMTIGIVGLPAYFLLDRRRKRLLKQHEETEDKGDNDASSEIKENDEEE